MPPEVSDVNSLMKELASWIDTSLENGEIPVPIIAVLAHYQFATIHPYYDGNGRIARLMTNLYFTLWRLWIERNLFFRRILRKKLTWLL